MTDDKLKALIDFEESAALSDIEKLVLRFTVAMTSTPVLVPDELFRELEGRFAEPQLVELTSAIA